MSQPCGACALGWPVVRRFADVATIRIKLPELEGESITEGTILKWQKKVGDYCFKGADLAVVEFRKDFRKVIKAEENGTLVEVLAKLGSNVDAGQAVAVLKPDGEASHGLPDAQNFAVKLSLPWEQHSSAGFQRKVEIRKSSVPNGGLGRFACEPIPKGAPVRIDRVQPLEEFLAENSPGSTCPGGGIAVELRSASDIDRWCEHFAFPGAADDEVKDIELKTSWFIAGVPAARTDRGEGLSYVLAHSFHTNHNTEAVNVVTKVRDGHLIHEASQDVRPGDELFLDYTNMDLQPFVKEWCTKREGLSDVQSFARKLLQQSERQSTI